jgi:hypothetical protein
MMAADVDVFEGQFFPEDLRLCRDLRQHFEGKGIKYAPADVAARFCFERHPHRPVYDGAFAVHGLLNFKDWLR